MTEPSPITKIVKRNGSLVAYDRERIAMAILKAATACGRPDRALADRMAAKVEAALAATYGSESIPSVEDIQDVVETVLMENRLHTIARDYIIYRHKRTLAREARAYNFHVTDNIPYRKLYEILRWNMDHGCHSVETLNRIVRRGELPDLIKAAERRYDEEIRLAATRIVQHKDRVRIVIVAGPSSSGKTTTTIKLGEHLSEAGLSLKAINIDNYFFDLDQHPKDEFGDYDYETPRALDLPLINTHLVLLLQGKPIKTPNYDFKTGKRTLEVHPLRLNKKEILLIDSLHGLHGDMTARVPQESKFKLYVEALGQFKTEEGTLMRWADNRLLRRMIRDKDHRNLQPVGTLTHWHYVRRSELTNIIPFIQYADCIVNSALPYELPILKARLFRTISSVTHRYRDDAKRLDAHIRANRVYALLKPIKSVRDDTCVPRTSLLREFIGGSRYKY